MSDRVAQQLGNYRLIRELGKGGFAQVYLGEHGYLKTQAAIKVLQTQLASNKQETFLAEARSIARLKHANIVRVLEFGVEGNTPFLVMEYAPNGSLRQRHPKGSRVPLKDILHYVKQVSAALQYAHHQKLIHRDVKPENMLLGARNELLLSDFGIAQVVQSIHYQKTQEIVGTITYMAPEQFQNQAYLTSDQYALGAVVYEWLSGDYPFHGSFTEIASQHLLVPPPPLHEKAPEISPAVEQVVMMALAKDPQQRFASMQEFATALEQACQTDQRTAVALPFSASLSPMLLPNSQTDSARQPLPDPQQPPNDISQPLPMQQKPRRPHLPVGRAILLIILVLLAMISGSGLTYYTAVLHPAQLLQAQATMTAQTRQTLATAQANATATALQNLYIQVTSRKPVLQSPLSTNDAYDWHEYDSINGGSCTFKGGAYHASASVSHNNDGCSAMRTNFSNFAFQVEMTITRGDKGGLLFRYTSNTYNGYTFAIGQDGSYVLSVANNGAPNTLLNSFSPAIKTGLNQSNLIAVVARGSDFYLYVNKQYLAHVSESTFSSGEIGVTGYHYTHFTEVAFRNAQVWNL